mgnify:CR=1 FL=1
MSENNKLIFLDVDATLYSKEQRLVPESTIKAIHEAQENGHKDDLLFILKKRFSILAATVIFVLTEFTSFLMAKRSITKQFLKQWSNRSNGFAKKTISMELLKGKNVLISAIIMLTFIHIMDL